MKKILSYLILEYFRFFARIQLKKNPHATVIGITGSAGKTSTRLAIVHILKTHGIVKHSSHANSQSGISLNILGLHPISYSVLDWLRLALLAPIQLLINWKHFDYYVVEMGIDGPDEPNNMTYLLKIIKPHVGIVLNASLAHSGSFDHLVKDKSPKRRVEKLITIIAQEKMQLAKSINIKGVAVINIDQKEFARHRSDILARQITFGKSDKADVKIVDIQVDKKGFSLRLAYQSQNYILVLPDIFPEQYAYTFAAAVASVAAVGIPPSISLGRLSSYRAPAGRFRMFSGIHNSTIIDSSYNASPNTVLESLKLLKNVAGRHHKIAVIGDMRELGLSTKFTHKSLADWLPLYCDEVILYGNSTFTYTLPVLLSKKFRVKHFLKMSDLIKYLHTTVKPKSFVLFKGSQNNIFLERAVESILADPKDVNFLCRRGKYWDKVRAKSR